MKISYNWLKDIIDINSTPNEVSQMLTGCGLEVEHVENYQSVKGGLEGIVIGFVKEREKHPNADKLSVCKVDIGIGEDKQIVCGAPNVAAGQKVLVATVGATLYPSKGEPFKISKSKIRGEVSEGMICSEDEIGLGESHDGILILPDNYEVGKPASEYFKVYNDFIFEIGLTANRGDAASHLGTARDLRAITKCEVRNVDFEVPSINSSQQPVAVTIEDTEGCKRYTGLSISNIEVKPSPEWMQNRLRSIGINPINNIVDATNYVLHELGQPLHAFDADKIKGNQIIVKKAVAGGKFNTLDKTERTLKGHECMICDAEKPLALAGVFGGLDSGISDTTKNIFLESAYFDAATIRKAAKAHGLSTDASFRYERGTDPNITEIALKRVANLIIEIAGGNISSAIIDVYPTKIENTVIEFSLTKSNQLIGKEIEKERVTQILTALDIEILADKGDMLTISIPPYRSDVTRPADVTEEILRIYGLNNIEIGNDIKSTISYNETEQKVKLKNNLADYLSANGFNEIATNTLTKSAYYSEDELQNAVKMLNPLSSDLDIMRLNMLPSVLEALQYNNNRKLSNLKFYEFGKTYFKGNKTEAGGINLLENYVEQSHLVLAMTGSTENENWNQNNKQANYYIIKGFVQNILAKSKLTKLELVLTENANFDYVVAVNYKQKQIAIMGTVNQKLADKFDLHAPVFYADINVDLLVELNKNEKTTIKLVPAFPAVRRDLALLIDDAINYAQLEKIAVKTDSNLIKQVNVFDVYKGDKIESGKKSYALSFMLQDENKTLTDEEIDSVMKKLIKNFEKEVGASLRA
ncbi:MAG: phenylalanine--tRNA ligase subunit beta [Bacteroidia bacterium]